jgi:hypothetical protein
MDTSSHSVVTGGDETDETDEKDEKPDADADADADADTEYDDDDDSPPGSGRPVLTGEFLGRDCAAAAPSR